VATGDVLADLREPGAQIMVAQGGRGGMGNARFKSSTNRAPRKTTPGAEAERRELRLELSLLADVGLLGQPNAGKSTLIRGLSNARPKVADYPFTTLIPNIGVVRVNKLQSFVLADIPGLIAGASQGAGLGIRFLKHLARTRLLLHVVDLGMPECLGDEYKADVAAAAVTQIVDELALASPLLAAQPRWLVFNKCDLFSEEDASSYRDEIIEELTWDGSVYVVSAASGFGLERLAGDVMAYLERQSAMLAENPELSQEEVLRQRRMQQEVRTARVGDLPLEGQTPEEVEEEEVEVFYVK